jgi:hypothetical protein
MRIKLLFITIVLPILYAVGGTLLEVNHIIVAPAYWALYGWSCGAVMFALINEVK